MSTEVLARLQFAFTVTFHIIFPTMSIGLAGFLVIVEALWLKTRDALYLSIYKFWLTIFALGFGVGVVTGIVLSFEFGLGFAKFAQLAGPVIGPLIGWEVLTSFFLEAGFLGIMLFGMGRVGPRFHFFATCMVGVGTVLSASWILAANSWMQTPDGVAWQGGRLVVTNWWNVIVNPSWPFRLPHMLLAAYITGSFFVAGVSAWYLLKKRHVDFAKRSLSISIGAATILIACQVFLGDILGGVMFQHQPAKLEAAEGYWDALSPSPAPYYWFIVPNQRAQRNDFAISTPYLGSLLLTHSLNGRIPGLHTIPRDRQPIVAQVFYGFRTMFVIAILMFGTCVASIYLRLKHRLYTSRPFLKFLVVMTPAGFFATIGGWYTAETGRQPWVIYGLLRTADAVSPVSPNSLLISLFAFIAVYTLFGGSFLLFTIRHIKTGPRPADVPSDATSVISGSIKRGLMPAQSVAPGGR